MPNEISMYNSGPVVNQVGGNQYIHHQSVVSTSNNFGPSFFKTSTYQAHKNVNPSRVQNTCRWFLDHPTFQRWKNRDQDDLLWLSADPGCGKSVLSKALIDDRLVGDEQSTICYFFFKDNEEQNSIATAICAILHQLFCAKQNLFQKHAEKAVQKDNDNLKVDFGALWQVWESAAHDPSTGDVICILDALDECRQEDRDRLIRELERFYTTSRERRQVESRVKFLVTSRPYGDIERRFGKLTHRYPTIRLAADEEARNISDEINVVMQTKVDEIVEERGLTDEIREALKRRFSKIHNTTYLWLHLTLEVLRDCLGQTKTKLLRRIDELPDSVEQAYEAILQRGNRENEGHGRRLLEVIVAAQRPLTVSEIDIALEIQPSSKSCDDLDLEGVKNRRQWIRDACGLFVSVIDTRVYLIHQTAREFLLRQADGGTALGRWRHSIYLQDAHLVLAKVCIAYLHFKDFQKTYRQAAKSSRRGKQFLDYSANHWIYHMKKAAVMEDQWVSKAAELCQIGDGSFSFWVDYNQSRYFRNYRIYQNSTTLFWATTWGLLQVMQLLLGREGPDAEITDEVSKAAVGNRENGKAVMELLLDRRGADIRITEEVVKAAVGNERSGEAVMKLLLDRRGADIRITNEVVKAAAGNEENGEAVMKLLLDRRGADIRFTEPVVYQIVKSFGEDIITTLLDRRGADIRITKEVVQAAAQAWQIGAAVMKLLLDRQGTDIPATEGAVQQIFQLFDEDVIRLLLDRRGADIRITDEAVQAAARNWDSGEDVIKLLLDRRGADIKITEKVVQAAAGNRGYRRSGEAVMKLLLDRQGADISITEGAIYQFVKLFDKDMITLLLSRQGANIRITDAVVQAAARNWESGEDLMKLLLNRRGPNTKITNEVVNAAAGHERSGEAMMKLLLDRRVDIRITDEVMLAAAQNWKSGEDVIKLLLDRRGADIRIPDEVVKAAAGNERSGEAVIKLLLDRRGADIRITNEVVKAAAGNEESGEAVMKLLLDQRGADIRITKEVINAATGNEESGEAVMKLLLDHERLDVDTTYVVVEAAPANQEGGEVAMELLLDRQVADIRISNKIVEWLRGRRLH